MFGLKTFFKECFPSFLIFCSTRKYGLMENLNKNLSCFFKLGLWFYFSENKLFRLSLSLSLSLIYKFSFTLFFSLTLSLIF
jgi:hypothetical protein